jgi:hypothetical protein
MRRASKYELTGRGREKQILPEEPKRHRLNRNQFTQVESRARSAQLLVTDRPKPLG